MSAKEYKVGCDLCKDTTVAARIFYRQIKGEWRWLCPDCWEKHRIGYRVTPFMDEPEVLACDPFEGDFGDPGDRTMKDKIVTARKPGKCHLCGQEIKPGERIRSRTDIFENAIAYYRWCNACCMAMAESWKDDGAALEARAALRRTKQGPQ